MRKVEFFKFRDTSAPNTQKKIKLMEMRNYHDFYHAQKHININNNNQKTYQLLKDLYKK